jgi:hypothetical protein
MKNILFILSLVLAVSACNHSHKDNKATVPATDSTGLAEMKFFQHKIDFGSVPNDTVLTGKYNFLNPSRDTLIITSVNPDCTCTGFTLSNEKIPPKDSGYILLKVSTKNKSGAVVLYSTISANTPTRLYSLKMMANVR